LDDLTVTDTSVYHHVPLSLKNPSQRKILTYDERGLKSLHPWSVTDENSASHEGVVRNFLTFIPSIRKTLEEDLLTIIRVDITLYKIYLQVMRCSLIFICFFFSIKIDVIGVNCILAHGDQQLPAWWQL